MKADLPLSRRSFLRTSGIAASWVMAKMPLSLVDGLKIVRDNSNAIIEPLRERATRKGLLYGAAASFTQLRNDAPFRSHYTKECGILVPEFELKWSTLRPSKTVFNFKLSDWLLSFAQSNAMLFRGHTLVWHEDLPEWFHKTANKTNTQSLMEKHITTVVGHYAGKVHSWDVVNEPILPWQGQPGGLRNTPWLKFLGPEYIKTAFHIAAEADPKAILVLNQNHLEYENDGASACRKALLALLEKLTASKTPIHALGTQAHLIGNNRSLDHRKYCTFLNDVASLGLKIIVTELDVSDQHLPYNIPRRDSIVAETYSDFLTAVLQEPALIAILTWGLSDKYTWLSRYAPRADGFPVRPLLLDTQYQRKLAWTAVSGAFEKK